MFNKVLIYNTGGGIGDSIQILPLIEALRLEFKNTKFFYLSAHMNHFNSSLKDFNCKIDTLDLGIKYFGFRLWHSIIVKNRVNKTNNKSFDLIIDLQSKIRNTLILKMIPHKFFISSSINFALSKPKISLKKENKNIELIIKAINLSFNKKLKLIDYNMKKIDEKFFKESEKLLPNNNYVGLSITQGNVYRKKVWPLNKVIKLSEELVKNNKIPVFLIEKKNQEFKNKIKNLIPSALFPEHETSLNSPALVTCLGTRMDLVITIDNGIMHMLSLSKVPMISLFGPTDPLKFAPQYKNSKVLDSKKIYKSKNVSDITVEDVLLAAKEFLNFNNY